MKKLLFALPVLAIAFLFAHCDRPSLNEELNSVNPTANDRGGPCLVQFDKASATEVIICGTELNADKCSSCTNEKKQGRTVFPAGVAQILLTLNTPIEISLSSATGNTVTITTTTGVLIVTIPPGGGGCVKVRIDGSCGAVIV